MTGKYTNEFKINQDSYFIYTNFCNNKDYLYAGVCDGHGYQGEEVSSFLKDYIPFTLNKNLMKYSKNCFNNTNEIIHDIKETFLSVKNDLYANSEIDKEWSGSTCTSVLLLINKLFIINVGDSRSIIGKYTKNKEYIAYQLSNDHKPSVPEEKERILSAGGVIKQMTDDNGNSIGPLRIYMKDDNIPGLAMSRSFGDYYASLAGAICEPEVEEYILEDNDKFIIIASDGLWEYMTNDEVVNIVSDYYNKQDPTSCIEYLYKEAKKRWILQEGDNIDDITIILIFLD